MCGLLNRIFRNEDGAPAVEFALITPLFLLVCISLLEVGNYLADMNALEKGVRGGAMMAARFNTATDVTNAGAIKTRIENTIKKGNPDGTGSYLVAGWAEAGASVAITSRTETLADGTVITVFEFDATVPYVPIIPGFYDFVDNFTLRSVHEQAQIGY
jgi:Flp pilus assembly protein TadG